MCARIVVCLSFYLLAASGAPAAGPLPVSPGGQIDFQGIASACPTFSWTASANPERYELVVYAMPDPGGDAEGSVAPDLDAAPALQVAVPAGALAWTPPVESCLEPGGHFAWSVRAVDPTGGGEWSEPALFRVEPEPQLARLGEVLERALSRYLEARGVELEPDGELAALVAEELAAVGRAPDVAAAARTPEGRIVYRGGKRYLPGEAVPEPRGVFAEDVELWLEEGGSGPADKVQLVFATPEFDGDPSDAWAIIVEAEDSADPDDGKMFISTPSFFDVAQFFTDGSAILGELRELSLRRRPNPPIACTSFLQEGMFYWDEDIKSLCVCDGSSWEPIDSDNMGSCS